MPPDASRNSSVSAWRTLRIFNDSSNWLRRYSFSDSTRFASRYLEIFTCSLLTSNNCFNSKWCLRKNDEFPSHGSHLSQCFWNTPCSNAMKRMRSFSVWNSKKQEPIKNHSNATWTMEATKSGEKTPEVSLYTTATLALMHPENT